LRLRMPTLRALAADFHDVFQGSGFALVPLASGGFLLSGPAVSEPQALEPARCVGAAVEAGLPRSPALRRLSAEIEIWLHEHAVDAGARGRGPRPVASLGLASALASPMGQESVRVQLVGFDDASTGGTDEFLSSLDDHRVPVLRADRS